MSAPLLPSIETALMDTPLGTLLLGADGDVLVQCRFVEQPPQLYETRSSEVLEMAKRQLREYFAGVRREFSLPIRLDGTPFQQDVWRALQSIPFGSTTTYGAIAGVVQRRQAARAVGQAVGHNPISIIVPCHRVLATGGGLGGYAWGVDRKQYLIDLEQRI